MKKERAGRDKLDCRAIKCRSGAEQTNHREVQSMHFRASQEKTMTIIRIGQCMDAGAVRGQSALIEAITRVLERSGQVHKEPMLG